MFILEKVIEFVRKSHGLEKPLAEARLVVSGNDVLEVTSQRQLISVLSKPGQSCLSFVVDLPRTLGELAKIADEDDVFAMYLPNSQSASNDRKPVASVGSKQLRRRKK